MRVRIVRLQGHGLGQMRHRLVVPREPIQQIPQVNAAVVEGRVRVDVREIRVNRLLHVVDLLVQQPQIITHPKRRRMGPDNPFQILDRPTGIVPLGVDQSLSNLRVQVRRIIQNHVIQQIHGSVIALMLQQKPHKILPKSRDAQRAR